MPSKLVADFEPDDDALEALLQCGVVIEGDDAVPVLLECGVFVEDLVRCEFLADGPPVLGADGDDAHDEQGDDQVRWRRRRRFPRRVPWSKRR